MGGEVIGQVILAEPQFATQRPKERLEPQQRLQQANYTPGGVVAVSNVRKFVRQTIEQPRAIGGIRKLRGHNDDRPPDAERHRQQGLFRLKHFHFLAMRGGPMRPVFKQHFRQRFRRPQEPGQLPAAGEPKRGKPSGADGHNRHADKWQQNAKLSPRTKQRVRRWLSSTDCRTIDLRCVRIGQTLR